MNLELEELKERIVQTKKVSFDDVESLVSMVVDWNPLDDDYRYFAHDYLQECHCYFFYSYSLMTNNVSFIHDIFVTNKGELYIFNWFISKYEKRGKNDYLELLKFIHDQNIKVINLPKAQKI